MTNKKRPVNKPNAFNKKREPRNVYNLVALFTLCSNFMLNRADKILLYQADSPSRRSPHLLMPPPYPSPSRPAVRRPRAAGRGDLSAHGQPPRALSRH